MKQGDCAGPLADEGSGLRGMSSKYDEAELVATLVPALTSVLHIIAWPHHTNTEPCTYRILSCAWV